jgi:hypothetical protein
MPSNDENLPMALAQQQPAQTRLMRNRLSRQNTSQLTNRPIIVYGLRVPDNDPKMASVMRNIANLAILIAILQLITFVVILIVEDFAGTVSLYTALFTLIVFGFCVPLFGYHGAKKQDVNSLSLFCFGEGLVAAVGGCEFLFTILSVTAYLNYCSSETCVEEFKNASKASCEYGERIVQRSTCEEALQHWGFWTLLTVSGLLVCTGVVATRNSMELRNQVLDKSNEVVNGIRQNRVHVVPQSGVVATTTLIREGMQHYQQEEQATVVQGSNNVNNIPRAQPVVS